MKEKKQAEGIIEFSRNGHAYLIVESKGFNDDIFIHKNNVGHALDGDKVFIDILPGEKEGSKQGVVKGIIKRKRIDFSGVLDLIKNKNFAFVRTSGDKMPVDFYVPLENIKDAKNGDVVVVRLTRWGKKEKSPTGIVIKNLGKSKAHETEIGEIMFRHGIDYYFPEKVQNEADNIPLEIPEKEILKRKDMRSVFTITIDPESAKDFDDAISFEVLENGNFEIGVHIADVSHYVKPGSELDKEAYSRATSVYLVDRCIPMLPERLSNGICSLRPREDKLCFSVLFEIDSNGKVHNHNFKKTVINSDERLTYEQAQQIINGEYVGNPGFLEQVIERLNDIAKKIRAERFSSGAITFNRREPQFLLNKEGFPIDVFFHESDESHQLIEEYMLLANKYVATYVHKLGKQYVYRTHDLPDKEKLYELSALVKQFGYEFETDGGIEKTKKSLNEMLKKAQGSGESNMIETLAIRSMSKAIYSPQVIGHYGLGFKHYSHFTSPIRRYPDIIAHRLLWSYLQNREGNVSKLSSQCEHCSEMENRAAKAQRESIRYKQCEFMKDKVGQTFDAVISSVTDFGVFAEILENGCDGFISKDSLEAKNLYIDQENYCINNFDNGESYRLGGNIKVAISKVNMTRKQIDFKIH